MLKYFKLIKLSFIDRLAYREELFFSLFVGVLVFLGQYIFGSAVFYNRDLVGGFTLNQILFYYLFVRVVSEIVDSKLSFRINDMTLDGTVSNLIIKPVLIKPFLLFQDLGSVLVDVIIKIFFYIGFFLVIFGNLNIRVTYIPLFAISMVLSIIIGFNVVLLMGMMAFKIDNAKALIYTFRRIVLFLAGGVLPLSFFPSLFQTVLSYLPFKYMVDLPINILLSEIPVASIVDALIIQLIWGFGLWVFTSIMLQSAIKNNESVGI